MSGKKAKEQRKQDDEKVAYTISIDVMENGHLKVRGFPANPTMAMKAILNASGVVADYFFKAIAMGDAKNIIPAGPQLVGPDGKKVH